MAFGLSSISKGIRTGLRSVIDKPFGLVGDILRPDFDINIPKPEAPPGRADIDVEEQQRRLARRQLRGRQGTIRTGNLGVTSVANTASNILLGG